MAVIDRPRRDWPFGRSASSAAAWHIHTQYDGQWGCFTTSRSFAPWLRLGLADGYAVHLVFLWLASPELALARVARRVELGGHSVPDNVVRRRYAAGLRNFFTLYRSIATSWRVYDNSDLRHPRLIAMGEGDTTHIAQADVWARIVRQSAVAEAELGRARDVMADGDAVEEALQRAAQAARREYVRAGLSMPVWRCGRLVWVEPSDLERYDAGGHAADSRS